MNAIATLNFTGDIMCTKEQNDACKTQHGYDYNDVFADVTPLLADADYCVGNLETPFAGEDAEYSHALYSFNTPLSFAETVKNAGFDLVSTANNHCLDRQLAGLKKTLDSLDSVSLPHTGTARSREEREKLCIQNINGIQVAFLSYTYGTNAFANGFFLNEEESYAVNLFQPQETLPASIHLLDPPEVIAENMEKNKTETTPSPYLAQMEKEIANCRKAGADYVIVLMHSGGQYNPEPDPYTEFLVGKIRRAGADMIVGNHPHVVHKFENENEFPVFYSLGNFAFTPGTSPEGEKNPISATSVLLNVTLEKRDGRTKMTGASFRVTRSVILENGKAVVRPLFDLIAETEDPAKRKVLTDDLRIVVNTFLNQPLSRPVELRTEYRISV